MSKRSKKLKPRGVKIVKDTEAEVKMEEKSSLRGCIDCKQRGRTRHAFCDVHQKFVARKQDVCTEVVVKK